MNVALNYLIEANIGFVLMFLAYWTLLRRETNFALTRRFLVGGMIVSLVLPLFSFGGNGNGIPSFGNIVPAYLLPEIYVGQPVAAGGSKTEWVNHWQVAIWLYVAGAAVQLLRLLVQGIRLFVFFRTNRSWHVRGAYKVLYATDSLPVFSFFNRIVLGNANAFSPQEKEEMIRHEMVHAKKLHSADLVLMNIATVVLWFNPIVYVYARTLSEVHEFQADEETVNGHDVQSYCSLLARVTLQSADFSFANYFNQSITIKRINMMKTPKTKIKNWKRLILSCTIVVVLVVVACQDQVANQAGISGDAVAPDQVAQRFERLKSANPSFHYALIELNREAESRLQALEESYGLPQYGEFYEEGKAEPIKMAASGIALIHNGADPEKRSFIILEYRGEADENDATVSDVLTIVEETAQPEGGMESLITHMTAAIQYPKQALQEGVEGRVFVEFVVEKHGALTNFKVLKGIGAGCDEAALAAVKSSPAWIPARQGGKPVRQQMVLPITFSLPAE